MSLSGIMSYPGKKGEERRKGEREGVVPMQLVHTTLPSSLFSKSSFLPAIDDVFLLILCFNASALRSPEEKEKEKGKGSRKRKDSGK